MKDIEQRKAELREAANSTVPYSMSKIENESDYAAGYTKGEIETAKEALEIIDQQDAENQSLKEEVEGTNKLYQGALSFLAAKEEEVERLKEKLEKAIFSARGLEKSLYGIGQNRLGDHARALRKILTGSEENNDK